MYRVQITIDFGDGRHPDEDLPDRYFRFRRSARAFARRVQSRWGGAWVRITREKGKDREWGPDYDWVLAKEVVQ